MSREVLTMARISDFAGRADCGCVAHAGDVPCEHDLQELTYDEFVEYLCALLDECNTPPAQNILRPIEAEQKFVNEITHLVSEGRMSLADARGYWTKGPH